MDLSGPSTPPCLDLRFDRCSDPDSKRAPVKPTQGDTSLREAGGQAFPGRPSWWVAGPGVARLQAGQACLLWAVPHSGLPGSPTGTALGASSPSPRKPKLPPCQEVLLPLGQAQPSFPSPLRAACGPLPARSPFREGPSSESWAQECPPPPGSPPGRLLLSAVPLLQSWLCSLALELRSTSSSWPGTRPHVIEPAAHQGKGWTSG